MDVRDCIRSKADEVDRRFCFDLVCMYVIDMIMCLYLFKCNRLRGVEHKINVQGIGQDDRTTWLHVMEGREPVF